MRVEGTLKDRGHYRRKAVGYTALGLLLPVIAACELGRAAGDLLYLQTRRLHRWMRPCLYHPSPPGKP